MCICAALGMGVSSYLLQSCSIMGMLLDTDTHYNSHVDLGKHCLPASRQAEMARGRCCSGTRSTCSAACPPASCAAASRRCPNRSTCNSAHSMQVLLQPACKRVCMFLSWRECKQGQWVAPRKDVVSYPSVAVGTHSLG